MQILVRNLNFTLARNRTDSDVAPVVQLARELGLSQLIPIAMYELQKWYPCAAAYDDRCKYVSVRTSVLDRDDLRILILGKEALRDAMEMAFDALLRIAGRARSCLGATLEDRTQCNDSKREWLQGKRGIHREQLAFPDCRDPLWILQEMKEQLENRDRGQHRNTFKFPSKFLSRAFPNG